MHRVLVAGAWVQERGGQKDFDAAPINVELKNLGHPVANITSTFNRMMERRPAWALQVRKSGSARQARKKYRVTSAGLKEVRRMLSGVPGDDGDDA
jgi:hypothetical protein